MLSSVNRLTLIGFTGRDPESRYTNGGDLVVTLSVATSISYKNKAGLKVERTEWHSLVMYRQQAKFAQEYIKKGRLVFAEGRLQSRKYTDKNGIERRAYEVICDKISLLADGKYNENQTEDKSVNSEEQEQMAVEAMPAPVPLPVDLDDDIPL